MNRRKVGGIQELFLVGNSNLVPFDFFSPATVLRSQPSTRSLMARSGLGQLRRTSSSFRCSYTFRFPGERISYNRKVSTGTEGNIIISEEIQHSTSFSG